MKSPCLLGRDGLLWSLILYVFCSYWQPGFTRTEVSNTIFQAKNLGIIIILSLCLKFLTFLMVSFNHSKKKKKVCFSLNSGCCLIFKLIWFLNQLTYLQLVVLHNYFSRNKTWSYIIGPFTLYRPFLPNNLPIPKDCLGHLTLYGLCIWLCSWLQSWIPDILKFYGTLTNRNGLSSCLGDGACCIPLAGI